MLRKTNEFIIMRLQILSAVKMTFQDSDFPWIKIFLVGDLLHDITKINN